MKKVSKFLGLRGKSIAAMLVFMACGTIAVAQPNPNILGAMEQEVSNASSTAQNIMALIAWLFLGIGIVASIYCAVTESQRLKTSIIATVAAGFLLTIGYSVGLF